MTKALLKFCTTSHLLRLFLLALPFLLEVCLSSRWSPHFSLHALALIPLSLAKVQLSPTMTLSPLPMIFYSGLTALFLLLMAKADPAFLPTALSVALRPLFLFQQAQYAQVFPLKPASFCTLFADLGSTNKSATSLLLLSDSRSVLATLSSPPSFLLSQTLWQIWQELSTLSCSIRLHGSPDTRFSRGTTRLTSWPDGDRYLRPPQSLAVSLHLSFVTTLVFSRTGGVLSHQNSLTHRFRQFSPRNLCSLVFAATDTAFF